MVDFFIGRFDVHINTNICLFYDTRKIMHGKVNIYNNNWLFACLSLLHENKKKKTYYTYVDFSNSPFKTLSPRSIYTNAHPYSDFPPFIMIIPLAAPLSL